MDKPQNTGTAAVTSNLSRMSDHVNPPQPELLDDEALATGMDGMHISDPAHLVPLNNGWIREVVEGEKSEEIIHMYYWTPMGNKVQSEEALDSFLCLYDLTHENFNFKKVEFGLCDNNKEITTSKGPGRHKKPHIQDPVAAMQKKAEGGSAAITAARRMVTAAEALAAIPQAEPANLAVKAAKLAAAATKVMEIAAKDLVSAGKVKQASVKAAEASEKEAAKALNLARNRAARARENAAAAAAAPAQVQSVLTCAKLTVAAAERTTGFANAVAVARAIEAAKEAASFAAEAAKEAASAAAEAAASAEAP